MNDLLSENTPRVFNEKRMEAGYNRHEVYCKVSTNCTINIVRDTKLGSAQVLKPENFV